MTEQEEKQLKSEARNGVETVQNAFVMGEQKVSSGKDEDLQLPRWP